MPKKIGEILIARGIISEKELDQALQIQKSSGERLGQILVSAGHVNRLALSLAVAEQANLPHIDLRKEQVDPEIAQLLDPEICREYGCIPVRMKGKTLQVAVVDPAHIEQCPSTDRKDPSRQDQVSGHQ